MDLINLLMKYFHDYKQSETQKDHWTLEYVLKKARSRLRLSYLYKGSKEDVARERKEFIKLAARLNEDVTETVTVCAQLGRDILKIALDTGSESKAWQTGILAAKILAEEDEDRQNTEDLAVIARKYSDRDEFRKAVSALGWDVDEAEARVNWNQLQRVHIDQHIIRYFKDNPGAKFGSLMDALLRDDLVSNNNRGSSDYTNINKRVSRLKESDSLITQGSGFAVKPSFVDAL